MALACTPFHNGRLFAVRSFVSAAVFAVLMVILACVMQIAGSGSALVEGFHHEHPARTSAVVQNDVIASVAMSAPVMDAAQDAELTDCNGHADHRTGSDTKKCCASICCAADLAWTCGHMHILVDQNSPLWLFSEQLVVLKHASGLDRPPDLRA